MIRRAGLFTLLALIIWIVVSVAISIGASLRHDEVRDPQPEESAASVFDHFTS